MFLIEILGTTSSDALSHNPLNGYYIESAFVAVKPQVFLDKYLPEHPGIPLVTYESFKKASEQRPESEMYEPLIDALKPFLKTGWSMINTSTNPDPDSGFIDGHKIKPDITVYTDRKPSIDNPCRAFSGIEVTSRFAYTSSKNSYLQTFFWRLSHARSALRGIDETFEAQHNVDLKIQDLLKAHHDPVGRGYHREGEVYTRLHDSHSVENIPTILAEGDVEAGESVSCGVFDPEWTIPTNSTIRSHRHYRIVLGVVGEPIAEFRSTWELTKCMLDAIKAHRDAVLNAKVKHCDISPGNILIVRSQDGKATGNLIDWELSKYCEEEGNRVYERAGTVQFMAARLLSKEPTAQTISNDLESFMLLWFAACYAPNKMSPAYRGKMLYAYDTLNRLIKGNFMLVRPATPCRFQLHSTSLTKILVKLMQQYSAHYAMPYNNDEALESDIIKKQAMLETHGWMIDTMQEALKDEDWNATTDCQRLGSSLLSQASQSRDKRSE
ncbi:hypothetical protein F5890DRAFT_1644962 [Lentinula detonsa]|uniref:Fungal-type protein kinase domain-containing protein n=1 Tax=Lentinula detonsa TaxID=2804962 RepID=A0AA38PNX3_9AGAR|nr:hypothetical protein F5890DRAFT_1644962 [Lentinula detonsa]